MYSAVYVHQYCDKQLHLSPDRSNSNALALTPTHTHRLVDGTNAQYVNYEDFRPYLKLELQYISNPNPNPNPICSFNDEDRAVPVARSMAAGSCLLSASLLLRRRCPLCYPPHRAIQSTRSRRTVPWHLKSSQHQHHHGAARSHECHEREPARYHICVLARAPVHAAAARVPSHPYHKALASPTL